MVGRIDRGVKKSKNERDGMGKKRGRGKEDLPGRKREGKRIEVYGEGG